MITIQLSTSPVLAHLLALDLQPVEVLTEREFLADLTQENILVQALELADLRPVALAIPPSPPNRLLLNLKQLLCSRFQKLI